MTNQSNNNIVIRFMEIRDLKKVLVIEKESFSAPWTQSLFFSELTNNRYAKYFVLEKENEVAGYLGLWHQGSNFHITNLAVSIKLRRRGYGEKLLKFIEKIALINKINKISLEVRRSNCIAQEMYKKYGYKVMRVLRNYYQEEKEDALVMEKKVVSND